MLFNLIIGIIAGVCSRYVEKPLGGLIREQLDMPEADLRVLAFVVSLLAASLMIAIAGVNGMPLVLLIGGGLGIFGSHVMKFGRAQKAMLEQKMQERKATAGTGSSFSADDAAEAAEDAVKKTASKAKTTAKSTVKKAAPKKKPTSK